MSQKAERLVSEVLGDAAHYDVQEVVTLLCGLKSKVSYYRFVKSAPFPIFDFGQVKKVMREDLIAWVDQCKVNGDTQK